jgi:hypothetical protein
VTEAPIEIDNSASDKAFKETLTSISIFLKLCHKLLTDKVNQQAANVDLEMRKNIILDFFKFCYPVIEQN